MWEFWGNSENVVFKESLPHKKRSLYRKVLCLLYKKNPQLLFLFLLSHYLRVSSFIPTPTTTPRRAARRLFEPSCVTLADKRTAGAGQNEGRDSVNVAAVHDGQLKREV